MTTNRSYRAPSCRIGSVLTCERWGEVEVVAMGGGAVPWPMCRPRRLGKLSPVLCGDLVTAVREESVEELVRLFGFRFSTATRLRQAMGIGRFTPGTLRAISRRAGTYTTRGHRQPRKES